MKGIQVKQGDCLELLKELDDESVDLLCVDPPYGISMMGKDWDRAVPPVEVWQECLRVLKPGAFGFILCTPRQDCLAQMIVRLGTAGFETGFTSLYWVYASGFTKAANLSKVADKRAGVEREVIGQVMRPDGRIHPSDSIDGGGLGRSMINDDNWTPSDTPNAITAPATEEAKQVDGAYAGFQPKPATEPVIVVMKPLDQRTYLDQVLDNGKGCTWLDDGRIPTEETLKQGKTGLAKDKFFLKGEVTEIEKESNPLGRFPANVLVEDDALNDGVERTTGFRKATGKDDRGKPGYTVRRHDTDDRGHPGTGSFSKYFDLDAWHSRAMEALPERIRRVFPFLPVPKAAVKEKNRGVQERPKEGSDGVIKMVRNNHISVKPQKLMQYLVTIGSRKGDVVLDPYCGSGTTGVSCMLHGRQFIGMELDPEYVEIAKDRIFGCLGPLFASAAREDFEE